MIPIHIMHNLILPKDSTGTYTKMKLCFILHRKKVLSELFETVLCLFGPLKSSGSHNFVHTYQILTKSIFLKGMLQDIFEYNLKLLPLKKEHHPQQDKKNY